MGLTEAEFRGLFDDHHWPLRAYVSRRVPNPADAEDVVVEIFSVVWRRRDDLPTAPSDRRMWLYGVARLTVVNHHRSTSRFDRLNVRLAAQASPTPVVFEVDEIADTSVAMEALALLGESDKELIRLAVWEEFSHAEIAKVIGTSTPNVAVRLHRAKRRLRREFDRLVQGSSGNGQVVGEVSTELTTEEETRR